MKTRKIKTIHKLIRNQKLYFYLINVLPKNERISLKTSLCCLYDGVHLILRFICNLVWTFKTQWLLYVSSKFNLQKFHVLPTEFICVFCGDLKHSDYFIFNTEWQDCVKNKPCFHCAAGSRPCLQLRLMSVFKETNIVCQSRNFQLSTAMITTWRVCEFVKATETRGSCFQVLK